LQVSPRHIEADRISEDMIIVIGSDVLASFMDGDDQLNLIVQILCESRVGHLADLSILDGQQSVCWLQEKERSFLA